MISLFPDITNHYNETITVEEGLRRIKEGNSKERIQSYRKAKMDSLKRSLPLVTWSGTFTERKADSLTAHSGLIVLDFDHVGSDYKEELKKDPYIYAAWVSPSGDGVKALVKIKEHQSHVEHFYALKRRFPKMDDSGKDVSRACFESYDPELYLNEGAEVFTEKSKPIDTKAIEKRILKIIEDSREGDRNNTLLRAARLAGGYIASGVLDESFTEKIKHKACAIGLYQHEVDETTANGINYGKANPITDPVYSMPESILSGKKQEDEWLTLVYHNEIPQGMDIGSEHFDTHFRLKPKTMTGIFGIDNVGKTTFWTFLMVAYSKRHGVKWLVFAKENNEAAIRQKVVEIYLGKQMHQAGDAELVGGLDFAYEHFDIVRNDLDIDKDNFIEVCDNLYKDHHGIFIDPYNAFQYDASPKSNYAFLDSLRAFQNKSGVSFYISMHISTEKARNWVYNDKDSITDFEGNEIGVKGQMKIPRKNFVEGGQPIANKLDDIMIVHRLPKVEQLRRYTLVSVDKVKEEQTGGMVSFDEPILFQKSGIYDTFTDNKGVNPVTGSKEGKVIVRGSFEHKLREETNLPF